MVAGGAVGLTAAFEVEGADDGGEELALTEAEAAAGTAAGPTAVAGTLVFEVLAAWVLLEWRTHREIPKPATRAAGTLVEKFFSRGVDVLRAGELQVGKFFDFNRSRSLAACRFRSGFGCLF